MDAASVLYESETDRIDATRRHLQEAIGRSGQHGVNFDFIAADGRVTILVRWRSFSCNVPVMFADDFETYESSSLKQDATT